MHNCLEDDINLSIKLTTDFLKEHPKSATKSCKTKEKQIENIKKSFKKIIAPNKRRTKPDELTSIILETVYQHKKEDRGKTQEHYNNQKQAEMMIGELLEKYIFHKGKKYEWVFTAECITAVDFIKKTKRGWTTLQIKNSDNTENSSASKVRGNTTIIKWHRRFSEVKLKTPKLKKDGTLSKKGISEEEYKARLISKDLTPYYTPQYNWDNFPDKKLKKDISEKNFREFIAKYFQENPPTNDY